MRFVNLYEEQKIALFEGLCCFPDQKVLKKNMIIAKKIKEINNKDDSEFISSGLKIRMQQQFEKNGLSKEEIEKKLKKIIKIKKEGELAEWEKLKNG